MNTPKESPQVKRLKAKIAKMAEENDMLLEELVETRNKLRAMTNKAETLQDEWLHKAMAKPSGIQTYRPRIAVRPLTKRPE